MDDLISRRAAIDAVERKTYRHTYLDQIIDILNDLPSAQPERKTGKWERIPFSFSDGYRCSVCGQKSLEKYWHFCPKCGAQMLDVPDTDVGELGGAEDE